MIQVNIYYWQIPFLFWWAIALSIVVYRRWLNHELGLANKVMTFPLLFAFALLDVFTNWTLVLLLMGEPPDGAFTISERFYLYRGALKEQTGEWKLFIADSICTLLDQFDEGHC